MTPEEQIEAIRSAALAKLLWLLELPGMTTTTSGGDAAWAPWLAALRSSVDWCDEKLAE